MSIVLRRSPPGWRDPRLPPRDAAIPAIHRPGFEMEDAAGSKVPGAREPRVALLEAALFAAEEPLTSRKLAAAAGLADGTEARRLVRKLQALYEQDGSAFAVQEVAGGFQLQTRSEFHHWLARARRVPGESRLTPASRETLAIIAYRQPITRAAVEAIRGVQCSEVLRLLMERGLVRIAGREDSLGRPVLYGTTKRFLQVFGLRAIEDLPKRG